MKVSVAWLVGSKSGPYTLRSILGDSVCVKCRCSEKQEAQVVAFACEDASNVTRQDRLVNDASKLGLNVMAFHLLFNGSMRPEKLRTDFKYQAILHQHQSHPSTPLNLSDGERRQQ
jgi:hypothetical protein